MDKYTLVGWYNNVMKYSWRIVGSHFFFIAMACVICFATYRALGSLPEAEATIANKATIVQCGAVILGLFSIVLTALQVRANATWNKVLSYHNHFGSLVTADTVEKVGAVAVKFEIVDTIADGKEIPAAIAKQIRDDVASYRTIGCYLDDFEEFCLAVNAGVVDSDYAYSLEATRIIRAWTVYKLFVMECRDRPGSSPYSYKQLQAVAHRWGEKRSSDLAKLRKREEDDRKREQKRDAKQSRNGASPSAF